MIRAMVAASVVSLHLARFDHLRTAAPVALGDRPGLLFCDVGADCRAAGNADRASLTRLTALRSKGTWYGRDPVAMARAHGPDGSGS